MPARQSLGRDFNLLWTAYAVSTAGTRLAFDAFALIAIQVLHSSATQVSILAAAGLAVGAMLAVPAGPWVEFHRKRPVMITADVLRSLALLSIPAAYALGGLGFGQLVGVSMVLAAANIVFTAASNACLKALVAPAHLLTANSRFEATSWTATALGPPLGGVAVGLLGPLTTVLLDAVSYLLSALGIRAIRGAEQAPKHAPRFRISELTAGWRFILRSAQLRSLFLNTVLVNGLIMATAPLMAVLMLRDLGFALWQHGLAFGLPCVGGLIGARLTRPLVAKFSQHRVMRAAGTLRACWSIGLVFVQPGAYGLLYVIFVQFGLIICMSVFTPVFATYRLQHTDTGQVSRALSAWSITSTATIATLTAGWGVLAGVIGPRSAVGVAGLLLLATPVLLLSPARRRMSC